MQTDDSRTLVDESPEQMPMETADSNCEPEEGAIFEEEDSVIWGS